MNRRGLIFILVIGLIFFPTIGKTEERTVTDQLGRRIAVPADPLRIVALAPSITEVVFALGEERRLVGATQFSHYPPDAAKLPKVGSYVKLDLERIVALKPDLCIGIKDGNPKHAIDRMTALNIPVYAVDPRGLDAVMEVVVRIGQLLGAEKKADELVSDMKRRIDFVDHRVSAATHTPRIFLQIGIDPIVSIGTDTFLHELIVRAGGINVAAGSTPYPRFSMEQVLGFSPEVLIITSMERGGDFDQIKAGWRKWKEIPATQNDRIHLVDSDIIDRPTPRMVEGLEMLAKIIHPGLFQEGSPAEKNR